ncbi:MAG: ATP-binding cassette domain-containing protein [Pseudohongiellaceae bacterium]
MPLPPDTYILVDQVSHAYQPGPYALEDIDLQIGRGMFGLLGSNGAGKSTLMRIICTLLEPTQGRVLVAGHDVVTERLAARKLIGYLPQDFGAWGGQKVGAVLDILASLSGLTDTRERKKKVEAALEGVGLQEVSERKVKNLSGGMLRRLGVAQALIHNPSVLIMDEPTVGLDPEERLRFRQLMSDLSQDRAIVLSTHIIADLGSSCSDMALIHRGRVEFRGPPTELIALAEGKVFEIAASPALSEELERRDSFEIVAQSFRNGETIFRGVDGLGMPFKEAVPVTNITLEEAYLAYTLGQGRQITEEDYSEMTTDLETA